MRILADDMTEYEFADFDVNIYEAEYGVHLI